MSYLYVDSTYDLTLGILSKDLNWLSFDTYSGHKASAIIQSKTYDLLKKCGLATSSLSGIITVNGPGFYTGLRLAEGFSDIFAVFGVKQFSFYTYEIPRWCGYSEGVWFTKAYRGEYFFYRWSEASESKELKRAQDLVENIHDKNCFIHSLLCLDLLSSEVARDPVETQALLLKYPELIFKNVIAKQPCEPFYFRAPEDEFKVNP